MRRAINLAVIVIVIATAISASAFANDSFVCIPRYSVGYNFEKKSGSWHPTQFDVTGEKHILHKMQGKLVWSTSGGPVGGNGVDIGCQGIDQFGFAQCGGSPLIQITFNRKNLRYLAVFAAGYVTNDPDGENTPGMEIGTCSKFEK